MMHSANGPRRGRATRRAAPALVAVVTALAWATPPAAFEFRCVFEQRLGGPEGPSAAISETVSIRERTATTAEIRSATEINESEILLGARFISFIEPFRSGGIIITTVPQNGGASIRSVQRAASSGTLEAYQDRGTCERRG